MEITQIKLYELLKDKIGDKETEAFIYIIEEKMDAKFDQRKNELATKGDITSLKNEFASLRLEFVELRLSTKEDMMKMKEDIFRTILLTSLGQLVAIVACVISIVLLFVKK